MVDEFPNGVFFVDLSALRDPALWPTMLTACPLRSHSLRTWVVVRSTLCELLPRLEPNSQPWAWNPARRSAARSGAVARSDVANPGSTSAGCDFAGDSFAGHDHNGSTFRGIDGRGTNFNQTRNHGSIFAEACLQGATFRRARLDGRTWGGARRA